MRTLNLSIFFLFAFFKVFGQSEIEIEQLKKYYATFQPEYIQGYLNKTCLKSGDNLFFKLWINSTSQSPHNLSVVVYAEILDQTNKVLSRQKLRVSHGRADGFFTMTPALAPGFYTFRAFTLWMTNVGDWSFFSHPIVVGDQSGNFPKFEDLPTPTGKNNLKIRKPRDGQLQIPLDTAIVGKLLAHQMGKLVYSRQIGINDSLVHVVPVGTNCGSVEVGLFDLSGRLVAESTFSPQEGQSGIEIYAPRKVFQPREKLDVKLVIQDEISIENEILFSVVRKTSPIPTRQTFTGSVPWSRLLGTFPTQKIPREIFIFPPNGKSLASIEFPNGPPRENEKMPLSTKLIEQVYQLSPAVSRMDFLMLPADVTYLPKDYLALPTLKDFFQEVVPEARVRRNGALQSIYLRNTENPNHIFFYSKSPLLLVDNKIITDQAQFLSLAPETISSINFTWRTETINETGVETLANTGVIAVYTRTGEGRGTEDIYKDFAKSAKFNFPIHDQALRTADVLPDFRSEIYWLPTFHINESKRVSFSLSDDLGTFIINVVARSSEGKFITQSFEFQVSRGQ